MNRLEPVYKNLKMQIIKIGIIFLLIFIPAISYSQYGTMLSHFKFKNKEIRFFLENISANEIKIPMLIFRMDSGILNEKYYSISNDTIYLMFNDSADAQVRLSMYPKTVNVHIDGVYSWDTLLPEYEVIFDFELNSPALKQIKGVVIYYNNKVLAKGGYS
jgi:hypothetical protein